MKLETIEKDNTWMSSNDFKESHQYFDKPKDKLIKTSNNLNYPVSEDRKMILAYL